MLSWTHCARLDRTERRSEMSAVSHEPAQFARGKERSSWQLFIPELLASSTIIAMWLAVLFSAVFGENIVNATAGGDSSSVPSSVAVALFAFLATWVVAWFGFRHKRKD
jgi:hypothetical protein